MSFGKNQGAGVATVTGVGVLRPEAFVRAVPRTLEQVRRANGEHEDERDHRGTTNHELPPEPSAYAPLRGVPREELVDVHLPTIAYVFVALLLI